MLYRYISRWIKVSNKKKNVPIYYVHIPKTGGTFVNYVLRSTNIKSTNIFSQASHPRYKNKKNINFTVIRHPIERFESYLNFKYGKTKHRLDTTTKTASLNKIVSNMNKREIKQLKKKFRPIKYYSKDIDIFITINMFSKFLLFFGYNLELQNYKHKNVSDKIRGSLNKKNRTKIEELYKEDMKLYNNLIQKKLIYEDNY